jgi:uncharacterized protein YbaR (Trm112 family)
MQNHEKKNNCPDCGRPMLMEKETKYDIITAMERNVLKCTQCRRWKYEGSD